MSIILALRLVYVIRPGFVRVQFFVVALMFRLCACVCKAPINGALRGRCKGS